MDVDGPDFEVLESAREVLAEQQVLASVLAAPYREELATAYGADKLIKLACLYELIGLPDCAAEVINRFADRLAEFGDTEPLPDALTPPLLGQRLSYREYLAKFESEPHLFLPSSESALTSTTA